MTKPARSALALLLVLSPALVGCATSDPAEPAGSAMASESMAMDDSMSDGAMTDDAMESDEAMDAMEPDAMSDEAMDDSMSDGAMADDAMMADHGAWIDQATYEADPATYHAAGDVVLYFSATWCPTCKETVANLDRDGVPAGLTVVRIDYDDNAALKKKYGITYQHTFVQVDADGNQLATFTGTLTGEAIAAETV